MDKCSMGGLHLTEQTPVLLESKTMAASLMDIGNSFGGSTSPLVSGSRNSSVEDDDDDVVFIESVQPPPTSAPAIADQRNFKFEHLWLGAPAFVFSDDQDQNHSNTKNPGDHSGRVGMSTLNWSWKPSEMMRTGTRCPSTVRSSRQTQLTLRDSKRTHAPAHPTAPWSGKAGAQTLPFLLAFERAHHHRPSVTTRRLRQPVPSLSSW